MAVIKAKQHKIVQFYLETLQRSLISPLVVTRIDGSQFVGAFGDTVTLQMDGLKAVARDYEFRTRNQPIEFDDIEGGEGIDIKINSHVVSATLLTDEHYLLDDIKFGEEVVRPQVQAVVDKFEGKVVAGLRNADFRHQINFSMADDPHEVTLESKRLMDADKVAPNTGRAFLVGSNVAASFLASDRLSKYDSTGLEGTPALREAIIGKLANSPVIEVAEMDPDEGFYLHKTGLLLANIAPKIPPSKSGSAAILNKNGFSVRHMTDYDSRFLRDRSIVNSFLGVNDVRDQRDINGDLVDVADRHNVRIIKLNLLDGGKVFAGSVTQS